MSDSKNFNYLFELPLIVIAAILLPLLHVCYYGAVVYLLPGKKDNDVSLSKQAQKLVQVDALETLCNTL